MTEPPSHRPLLRNLALLGATLVVYFAAPTGALPQDLSAVVSVAGLVAGLVALAVLITGQVRRYLNAPAGDTGVRLQTLLALLYLSVLVFAAGYAALAQATDDQFVDMETKVDSLYFTITTLATVGFGDVHATGQLARLLVTAHIIFNLVFVGALVSLISTRVRARPQG
jgi:voltage-gated potassium channel